MTRPGPRFLAALLILGAASARGGPAAAPPDRPEAPAFSLRDLDGHPISLARFRGSVVLLNFWATWCAPCRAEIPRLIALQKTLGGRGLRVVGISLDDDPAPVRPAYEELRMNYPVAIGDARLAERYGGILGLPATFLVDCDGRIASKHSGEIDAGFEKTIRPLLREEGCRTPESTHRKRIR
jgi:thiol-disulfide isomerase/thioredoxin